jgi:hypothetical protein
MIKLKKILLEFGNRWGIRNFWMSPDAKWINVNDHITYVLSVIAPYIYGKLTDKNLDEDDYEMIYDSAYDRGYIRIVIEGDTIFYSYKYKGNPPSRIQMLELKNFSIEHELKLKDATNSRFF